MGKIKRASKALEKARATLTGGWCKGDEAICRTKAATKSMVPDRFCAIGGVYEALDSEWVAHLFQGEVTIERVTGSCDEQLALTAFRYLDEAVDALADGRRSKLRKQARTALEWSDPSEPGETIVNFNDHALTTKKMVLTAFDRAIELARKAEQRERQRVSRARRRQAVEA